ncbi:hypothetical protein PVAND_009418 [Polypedilum vanderplanki]|uniref:Uncharacterized protein n=1 Tax=Polypedilum vanderplanki TaxID=319348 RepID=A0A9J6CCI8_POLVA|nr:hypothetical protein PVAND_009418 [Polypedilum vanderplanki]
MRQEIENFFNSSTIHGFKYFSKKFHWIERLFWILSLLSSLIITIFLITQLIIKVNKVPIITHIADHRVSIKDIDFPAITVCEGFVHVIDHYLEEVKYYERLMNIPRYFTNRTKEFCDELKYFDYLNYAQMLDEIENGEFKNIDKLGMKILKRLQVADIMTNRGILTKLNISASTDDFLDVLNEFRSDFVVDFLWNQLKGTKFSSILTEFGLCRTFNLTLPEDLFHKDLISDDFDHKYYSTFSREKTFDYKQIIPRRANSVDDTVFFEAECFEILLTETFKFEGQILMIHNPYELPNIQTKSIIINVRDNSVVNVRLIPEMFDIDESLYDDDPMDRNCYFDDEFELKFFKVYTKSNCESECLTNYMIKKCGCVEFYMIRNCTTRICSASDKSCYDETKNSFENQKHQCNCLQPCSYVKFDIEQSHGSDTWKEKFALKFISAPKHIYLKYKEASFPKFVRKQSFDFLTFLSFVGGLLGLFAGFSLLSAVELFYWFFVRIFIRKCNRKTTIVHPINEEIKKEPNIVKDFFKNSSIHGLSYAIDTNLIEKLFWTFFVTFSITSCILLSSKIRKYNTIVYEDSTLLKNKLNFPAVTFIPSYYVDRYFYENIANNYDQTDLKRKILKNPKTLDDFRKNLTKYSGYHNFILITKFANLTFETMSRYFEIMKENSMIDWFQQQSATWNNQYQVNFTMTRNFYGMSYTFNLMNTENILRYKRVNEEFHLKRNVSMLNQKSMPKIQKYKYPLKVGVNDRSKFQIKASEKEFEIYDFIRARFQKIIIHSPELLPTFMDLKMITDVPQSINIEIIAENIKTEESLRSQKPEDRECYFEDERQLKYFKIYTQKYCEMECIMDHLFNVCKCQMIDSIYKERKPFCLAINENCINTERAKISQQENNIKTNCTCLPLCNMLTYHVKYNQIKNEDNESIITVTMNGEDFILFRRYQQFTFSDIVSYVGGLLGLFAGISLLSIIEIFYFITIRLINDFLKCLRMKRS